MGAAARAALARGARSRARRGLPPCRPRGHAGLPAGLLCSAVSRAGLRLCSCAGKSRGCAALPGRLRAAGSGCEVTAQSHGPAVTPWPHTGLCWNWGHAPCRSSPCAATASPSVSQAGLGRVAELRVPAFPAGCSSADLLAPLPGPYGAGGAWGTRGELGPAQTAARQAGWELPAAPGSGAALRELFLQLPAAMGSGPAPGRAAPAPAVGREPHQRWGPFRPTDPACPVPTVSTEPQPRSRYAPVLPSRPRSPVRHRPPPRPRAPGCAVPRPNKHPWPSPVVSLLSVPSATLPRQGWGAEAVPLQKALLKVKIGAVRRPAHSAREGGGTNSP